MQISNNGIQSSANEWVKNARAGEITHAKKENASKPGKTISDYVSISANAGNSSEALVKARVNALPEIREERVALSKERMGNGYYNTAEFNNELAERLLEG